MLGVKAAAALAALLVCVRAAANYCGAAMCGKSDTHTFCQYPEGPGPRCSGFIDDRMSGAEKARVVARMNRRRSEAARGRTQLPPASNMLELRWVEELAREAQLWADQCVPPHYPEEHDACRDLYSITVGQCVASVVGEAPGLRPESMVDMWFLQGRQHPGAVSMYAMDGTKSPADFAQMLWARTYLVGCARSRFMNIFEGYHDVTNVGFWIVVMVRTAKRRDGEVDGRLRAVTRLVCNFAPRGPGGALWIPGVPAGACPARARPDPALPGLCAFHHNVSFAYDVSNATVLKEQLVLDAILEIERNYSLDYHGSLDQIYMTKMMAASMIDQTNDRPQYDSTDKKVPAELTTPADKKILANNTDDNIKNIIDDVIAQMIGETSTTGRVTKMTLNIVGRPKSYNIEELNLDHKVSENETTRPVDSAKEDDAYNYELDDFRGRSEPDFIAAVIESNVTTSLKPSSASVEIENAIEVTIAPGIPPIITTTTETAHHISSETSHALHTHIEDENTTPYVQNDILKRLLDLSEKSNENPSDPETSRQLEEALENMEKALAAPVSTKPKVRRELRSPPEEPRSEHPSPRTEVPQEQSQSQRFRDIGTPDSAPIMAILTRYAPLIKGYDTIFSRSSASITCHSLLLLLECIISKTLY